MSWLTRTAVAVRHLGPRQAGINLLYRTRRRMRRYEKYGHAAGALQWVGRAATPFLDHSGGTCLADGRLSAVGLTREVGDPPRWDVDAPLLWLYNLHYFAFLDQLGSSDQVRLILDWIERYQPSRHRPGWMPHPISLRLRQWTRRLFAAEDWTAPRRDRLFASIEAQATCLADTLERHLRGNHLLENALTLKFLAACFRGPAVERWDRLGDALLDQELDEQFLPDGGHFERTPMYQALLTRGLLDLVNVLPDSDRQRARLLERLPAMLGFLAALRHPDGDIALFNDAAFGIAPEPGTLIDYAARLGLKAPPGGPAAFPQTGYYAWHRGRDALIVDAGPIGPDYLPGHGHGDIFSFELSLDGRRVVVDGGTSTYEAGAERDWARSTRAHNTVEVAGADQCEFFAAFRVGRRGRPRDVTARVGEAGLHLAGWHDGYCRLPGRPTHHREIELTPEGALLVWDTVESALPQPAVSRLRFPPGAVVRTDGPRQAWVEVDGLALRVTAFGGEIAVEAGHYAPRFGERLPCSVLALRMDPGPEFGYVLAWKDLPTDIHPGGAEVAGRRVVRRTRRAVPPISGSHP
jgi:uncharacterized heparinase superfamily protein